MKHRIRNRIQCSLVAALIVQAPMPTISAERFTESSPICISKADLKALNEMPDQKHLELGFIDVTAPPFSADPGGVKDSTKAIQDAIVFARPRRLAVWFPFGTYTVSDTIECMAGVHDERFPDHRFPPFYEFWPISLRGEKKDGKRSTIRLAPNSPGFGEGEKEVKPVVQFHCRRANTRSVPYGPLTTIASQTGYNNLFYCLDVEIADGNPQAACLQFWLAEGSMAIDCEFRANNGYAGMYRTPMSGGALYDLSFVGGKYGIHVRNASTTLVGGRFKGQREAALRLNHEKGTAAFIGCEFEMDADIPVATGMEKDDVGAVFCDSVVRYAKAGSSKSVFHVGRPLYLQNLWIENAGLLVKGLGKESLPELKAPAEKGWTHVKELSWAYPEHLKVRGSEKPVANYLNGKQVDSLYSEISASANPPAPDLASRHILWRPGDLPVWNDPAWVNVKGAPFNAKGDGVTDDTAALQKAIDDSEKVFLPLGSYKTTRTLRLKPNTKITGAGQVYSLLVPTGVEGGDFIDPNNPKPAIATANEKSASTQLSFFSVFMPREIAPAASMLDWQCGGNSFYLGFSSITFSTDQDLIPWRHGIRPWTPWDWPQELLDLSKLTEIGKNTWHTGGAPGPDSHEGGIPNWPLIHVHGNGGGGFYPHQCQDGREHGFRNYRILVEDTEGPFSLYHAHLQFGRAESEMLIRNASNINVFNIKNEKINTIVLVRNSKNINILGIMGVGSITDKAKFVIEDSDNVRVANMFEVSGGKPGKTPGIISWKKGGESFDLPPGNWPALFKVDSAESPCGKSPK